MSTQRKATDKEFVERWMENYQRITISDFSRLMGYTPNADGSQPSGAISKRAINLRKRGVRLPKWEFTVRRFTGASADELNAIVRGNVPRPPTPTKDRLRKPPQI